MKVLLPTEYYPPFVRGGAEISIKLLAEQLAERGVETHILTPNYGDLAHFTQKNGVKIHRFKSPRKILYSNSDVPSQTYRKSRALFHWIIDKYVRLSAKEFGLKISNLQEREKFDLIHSQNTESILGLHEADVECPEIAHIRDLKLLCATGMKQINNKFCGECTSENIRTCLDTNLPLSNLIKKDLDRRKSKVKNFDHYISILKLFVRELNKEGIPKNKISLVPNPLSEKHISKLTKEEARNKLDLNFENMLVMFAGSLTKRKNAHLIPKLAKKMPNTDFIVGGEGPLRPTFENSKIENMHYQGLIPPEKIKHYYRAADCLVVPSGGRVVFEGQANGACIIAARKDVFLGVIKEGETGVFYEPGNIEKIKKTIYKP